MVFVFAGCWVEEERVGFAAVREPKRALVVAASAGALLFSVLLVVGLRARRLESSVLGAVSVSSVSCVGTAGANSRTLAPPSSSSSSELDSSSEVARVFKSCSRWFRRLIRSRFVCRVAWKLCRRVVVLMSRES